MSDLRARLTQLKKLRKAVVLAHNYQPYEVQMEADFVGDSLELSRKASKLDAEVILFCGVHFMAETAAILCPGKKVLLPDENAGCPMADRCHPRVLERVQREHPDAMTVCYINSSAAVKARCDLCCTSSNAVKIVATIPPERRVLFVPDRNLGRYVARKLGRDMILWNGCCPVHNRILPEMVKAMRAEHPGALVVAHPECLPEVTDLADEVCSTSGMFTYCRERPEKEFVIATETAMLPRLAAENPDKTFWPATKVADCPDMSLTTLEKMIWALEDLAPEVTVPVELAKRARVCIDRMLALS